MIGTNNIAKSPAPVEAGEQHILRIVKHHNAIKLQEIISELWRLGVKPPTDLELILNRLVIENKIIEIEYTVDMVNVDSIYLQAKTQINIRGRKTEAHRI